MSRTVSIYQLQNKAAYMVGLKDDMMCFVDFDEAYDYLVKLTDTNADKLAIKLFVDNGDKFVVDRPKQIIPNWVKGLFKKVNKYLSRLFGKKEPTTYEPFDQYEFLTKEFQRVNNVAESQVDYNALLNYNNNKTNTIIYNSPVIKENNYNKNNEKYKDNIIHKN